MYLLRVSMVAVIQKFFAEHSKPMLLFHPGFQNPHHLLSG
jgi:hypothetical protein